MEAHVPKSRTLVTKNNPFYSGNAQVCRRGEKRAASLPPGPGKRRPPVPVRQHELWSPLCGVLFSPHGKEGNGSLAYKWAGSSYTHRARLVARALIWGVGGGWMSAFVCQALPAGSVGARFPRRGAGSASDLDPPVSWVGLCLRFPGAVRLASALAAFLGNSLRSSTKGHV